jgi:hypothetical protein
MVGRSPWRAASAAVAGGGAAGGAADTDASMPDLLTDASMRDADAHAGADGSGRALRLPVLTMAVAFEECEKARRHCTASTLTPTPHQGAAPPPLP